MVLSSDAINLFYQKAVAAKHFKKICEDGNVRYQPCLFSKDFIGGEIIPMTYKQLPPNSLKEEDISFEDLIFAFKNTSPSINFWDVNAMYAFESKNPNPTIYDMLDEWNDKNEELKAKKMVLKLSHKCLFFNCKKS